MAVKIRLKRLGKKKAPVYRIIVADSRSPRNGRFIEELGYYDPSQEPSLVRVDSEKVDKWLKVGAKPTDTVARLLNLDGGASKKRADAQANDQSVESAAVEAVEAAETTDAPTEAEAATEAEPEAESAPEQA